ncbi:MAG: 3-oxoacyl-(acyl-carrier-protein) reductase [Puniceicoccaceae bacterium 5H]|nr:MAG: 3-oxoacyl-(acyl-carrier-protein) reductase [Puniceicoccaceae bacterium 5H]
MNDDSTRKVVIGGIGGGLGSALAWQLRAEGHPVAGIARRSTKRDAFAQANPDVPLFAADALDADAWATAFKQCQEALEGVDGYVHTIGNIALKPAHLMKEEEFRSVLDANLTSAFIALRTALEPMRRQKRGTIVFVSSVAARSGLANHEAIAAAKAGIEGMVRAAAATYVNFGVRVNAVAPGLMDTPAAGPLLANDTMRKVSASMHPQGRIGDPEEVASLIRWLLSDQANWVTGQVWSMDGGMSRILPKPKV